MQLFNAIQAKSNSCFIFDPKNFSVSSEMQLYSDTAEMEKSEVPTG